MNKNEVLNRLINFAFKDKVQEFDHTDLNSENKKFISNFTKAYNQYNEDISDDFIIDDLAKLNSRINREENDSVKIKRSKLSLNKWKSIAGIAILILLSYIVFDNREIIIPSETKQEYITFRTKLGEESEIELLDGTKVYLAENTVLKIPKDFSDYNRKLDIVGQAYFNVFKNPKSIFNIKSGKYQVKVLGTKFNIRSYEYEELITTTLKRGVVEVDMSGFKLNYNPKVLLRPRDKIIFNKKTKKYKLKRYAPGFRINWTKKSFVFHNLKLGDIAKNLSIFYDKEIVIEDNKLRDTPFSGEFNMTNIYENLNKIKNIRIFDITENNDTLRIKNGKAKRN
jgi:ferric-dicitrate binding protein FerR (iron transport regulator)